MTHIFLKVGWEVWRCGVADVDVDINYSNIYVDTAQVGD